MTGKYRVRIAVLAFGIALIFPLALKLSAQEDRTTELRQRFTRETDPVRKAKLLPKLSELEFQEIRKDFHDEKLPEAMAVLRQYHDEAAACRDMLDARNVDAERHPAGYKELEMSLRDSLRRLDDLLVMLTSDEQAPFVSVRKNIDEMNHMVMHKLFPRQPGGDGQKTKYDD